MTDTPPDDMREDGFPRGAEPEAEIVGDAEVVDPDGKAATFESPAESADDTAEEVAPDSGAAPGGAPEGDVHPDTVLASERLVDLQRLQAEYVNYKRRVDRDRALVQERAIEDVIEALLPVLDDIQGARTHGDLTDGPFAAIAEKLEGTLGRFRVERFGDPGEPFDPMRHEALMHTAWDADNEALPKDADVTTVVQVLQDGYRVGERVVRPARVSVADPE